MRSDGWLYGVTYGGGSNGVGTVFKVATNGTSFTNLVQFSTTNGANPFADLSLSGSNLFGSTYAGGSGNVGTIFSVNTNGSGFATLLHFVTTNGAYPLAGLCVSGNSLYGVTSAGGSAGNGIVFRLNTSGTGFTNLGNFPATIATTNDIGANPRGRVLAVGNVLYGTAQNGGVNGSGTVFSVALPPPDLQIKLSGNQVVLTWNDAGFFLQSAPNVLGFFTNFLGATSPLTNAIQPGNSFFRVQAN